MSTEVMAPVSTPVKVQKAHKSKDSTKKSAKKRRHEEQEDQSQEQTDADLANSQLLQESSQAAQQLSQSSSKRQRTSSPDTHMTPANNTYSPTETDLSTHSPFTQTTASFYVPLAPICHAFALPGLCAEHLSPLLLTYHPPLHGVVLSYTNPRLSDTAESAPASATAPEAKEAVLAKSISEYAASFIWLTADFTILRPQRDCVVEGNVVLMNEGYLGLVCWNFFNAGIERRRLPKSWSWVGSSSSGGSREDGKGDWMRGGKSAGREGDAQGYFVDSEGKKVEGVLRFRVRDFESAPSTERERGFLSIEGTLLDEEEDKAVDAEVRAKKGKRVGGRRNGTHSERPDS